MTVLSTSSVPPFTRLFPELLLFPGLLNELHGLCQRHLLKPGQTIMEEGTVCDRLYFIEEGMVRAYYYYNNDNDNTITSWFEIEGGYVYLPHSFFRGELAFKSVESLEPGLAWSISRLNLNRLAETYPCAAIIKDRVSEHYQVEYEYKLRMLRIHRAADRLAFFEARHPLIYRRAKLMHIASFLNMTLQTLSKLRLEQSKPRREK